MIRLGRIACVAMIAGLLRTGAGEAAPPLKKVTYLPHWVPQAQFAGFYVAHDKGFYERAGLDVEILRGGPEQPSSVWLAEGKVDFSEMFLSTAIEKRSQGVPCVNLAQLVLRSSLLLVAKRSSGILTPADFQGKTVTLWPEFDLQPLALFRKFDVRPRILPQRNTLNLLLRDGAHVASAMWYNEYHLLLNAGLDEDELVVFRYDDYGLNFPEDGLYCLESTYRADPAAACAFVRASIEGWLYAFEHEDEALDIVMQRVHEANMPTTRVHHRWMLRAMKDLMMPGGDSSRVGILQPEEYRRVASELVAAEVITNIPEFETFHETCAR